MPATHVSWARASPAAVPATNVPWPRPSTAELFGRLVRTTDLRIWAPFAKSARLPWTPESTIAIAGGVRPPSMPLQNLETPETRAHFCLFEYATPPASPTGESGGTASTYDFSPR